MGSEQKRDRVRQQGDRLARREVLGADDLDQHDVNAGFNPKILLRSYHDPERHEHG